MKLKQLLKTVLIAAVIIFAAGNMQAQTSALIDSGTVSKEDPRFLKYSFSMRLGGTNTQSTKAFEVPPDWNGIYEYSYYQNSVTDDSVKITHKFQGNDFSGKFTNLATLVTADTLELENTVVDTMFALYKDQYWFSLTGLNTPTIKNGDSTYVYGEAKFYKKLK